VVAFAPRLKRPYQPAGFITTQVGPHRRHGFAPRQVFGEEADLAWGGVESDHPAVDLLAARSAKTRRGFVVRLNQRAEPPQGECGRW
jgi:hypothetical protein